MVAESKVKITAETSQAEQALETLGEKIKKADERFLGLHEAAMTLASALSIGVMTEMIKSSVEAADQMGKMAQQSGVSVESLSRLSIAAKLSDVDTQSLAQGLGKLSKSMVEAQDVNSNAAAAYRALGVAVTDSNGKLRNADDVLKDVSDRFNDAKDGAGKTAIAMEIFGKAGASLIPLLNGGSEEMQKFAELSDKLGLTIKESTSTAAQEINDRFTVMGMALKSVGMQVTQNMMPTLDALSAILVDTATNTESLSRKADAFTFILKTAVAAGMGTVETFELIGTALGMLAAQANAVLHGDFDQMVEIGKMGREDIEKSIAGFSSQMDKLWSDADKKVEEHKAKRDKGDISFNVGEDKGNKAIDTGIMQLQNELFSKQMQLLGVLPEQVKVYQLAMQGATNEQIRQAQALADQAMAVDKQIKQRQQEAEAVKYTEKSMYELNKAYDASRAVMAELEMREKLRQANMLTGIERDRAVADVQLQITVNGLTKQRDAQVAALDERMRLDKEHKALTLELETKYQETRKQIILQFESQIQDVRETADNNRLKNEVSVANISANIQKADYANSLTLAQSLTSGLASNNRAAFELNKTMRLAGATIDGYAAIMAAYKDGSSWGGYWGGLAEAALATGFVVANLSSISSTQFQGGSSSVSSVSAGSLSSVSSGTVTSSSTTVQTQSVPTYAAPATQVNLTLVGSQFSYDQVVNEIIPLINQANDNGADIRVTTV